MKYDTFPITNASIDVTERCNLRCTYCFTHGKTNRDLTLEMGKATADWYFDHVDPNAGHYEFTFWGGEPLMKFKLIKKLVNYCERKSSKVIFGGTTNGLLLTEDKLKWLRDHKAKMMISIDGCKEIHDQFRVKPDGSGSWDDLEKRIPTILKVWPDARFRISVTEALAGRLAESVRWLYSQGVRWTAFSPVFEDPWSDDSMATLERDYEDLVLFLKSHKDLFCHHMTSPGQGISQNYPCGAGRSYVGFSVDGHIYPCHRFNKYDNQELREKWVIGDIWNGFNEKRQIFLDYPKHRGAQCGECDVYKFCAGGCYAVHSDLGGGDIFSLIDKYCKLERILFKVGSKMAPSMIRRSCVCYNMCYLEGTDNEIFYRDKNTDMTCICYNAEYTGERDEKVARSLV